LPEVRSRLLRFLTVEAATEWAPLIRTSADSVELAAAEARRVRTSELFWVASDLVELAEAAGGALPAFRLTPEDLPAPCGLLVWDRAGGNPEDTPVAVTWGPGGEPDGGPRSGVAVGIWLDGARVAAAHEDAAGSPDGYSGVGDPEERAEMARRRLLYFADAWIPWAGEPTEWEDHWYDQPDRLAVARTLIATWLLMGQTIVSERPVRTQPVERRRLVRRGDPVGDVRYVALRRLVRRENSEGETPRSNVSRHHRWWTRGHWRDQWYPSEDRHRPIWISAHVRGPDGAPLLHRETVHTLRR
jgi:hypothetical protein